jgi:ABC-type transporter Mla subunit MlaD
LNSENIFTTELRKILTYKEELLTDVNNMLYRRTDDIKRLQKVIVDTEQQFANCLQQIKTLGEEKEQRQKELEDLKRAAHKLVDMVNPQEGGEADERPLLERLLGALQKVLSFLTEAPIACVSHTLSFVKSFCPEARLEAFANGVAAECSVAEKIVKSVLQD